MAYEMKYIVVKDMGMELPIIFNPIRNHIDVARGQRVVSAGFFLAELDRTEAWPKFKVKAYGKSTTLGIDSRPEEDAKLIELELRRLI